MIAKETVEIICKTEEGSTNSLNKKIQSTNSLNKKRTNTFSIVHVL